MVPSVANGTSYAVTANKMYYYVFRVFLYWLKNHDEFPTTVSMYLSASHGAVILVIIKSNCYEMLAGPLL